MRCLILLLALALALLAASCAGYPVRLNEPVYHVSPVPCIAGMTTCEETP